MNGMLGRLAVLLLIAITSAACKGDDARASSDPAAVKAQQELIARREALAAQRKKLEDERDQIQVQIQEVEKNGGDTTNLTKQLTTITTQLETKNADMSEVISKIDRVVAQGDTTTREAAIAERERLAGVREAKFGEREAAVARREAAVAAREKETCSGGTTTIVQVPMPKSGSNYTRQDIDGLLVKAKEKMRAKGLLASDLGSGMTLEREALAAMKKDDFGAANLAATHLNLIVDNIKVDKQFVKTKHARLDALAKSIKSDPATESRLATELAAVVSEYNQGNPQAANKRLNEIAALLNK